MKILVTNDVGIFTDGIIGLAKWAKKLGGVTVIAPKVEQSGKSHSITLGKPYEILKVDYPENIEAYSVDSTPADCVRFAYLGLKKKFDLVLSGINQGMNLGNDIAYSGTNGAVFEAMYHNTKAIAYSTDFGPFDAAFENLDRVYDIIDKNDLFRFANIFNVNIPLEVKGVKITKQGGRTYSDHYENVGGNMYRAVGDWARIKTDDNTFDNQAVVNGYISITPLTVKRHVVDAYDKIIKEVDLNL